MRHLGMVPHQEYTDSHEALDFLADLVTENVDLDRVEAMMGPVPEPTTTALEEKSKTTITAQPKVKIGILQDAAFQFYYSENLEALEKAGGQLIYVNAMRDCALPELDGLYIGGGFPETSARELATNTTFRQSVKKATEI